MRDEAPWNPSVEFHCQRVGVGFEDLEGINGPQGDVTDDQEGDVLPAWFVGFLERVTGRTPQTVQFEDRLNGGLEEDGDTGRQDHDSQRRVGSMESTDGAEDGERVNTDEGDEEEDLVETVVEELVESEDPHGERCTTDGDEGQGVENQLVDVHQENCEQTRFGRSGGKGEENDHVDNREYEKKHTEEQASVDARAVNAHAL